MFVKEIPKISCLLVTAGGRFDLAKKSIYCYTKQTYRNKELVVLNEGPKSYQQDLQSYIDILDRDDIRTIWLNGEYTLGGLRNISVDLAEGDYWVQWDDDDFCMPHRLATQYSYMSKHPEAKVCYLTDQLHYFWDTQCLYWNNWKKWHSGGIKKHSLIPGTGMYKRGLNFRYPSSGEYCRAGEDTEFANDILYENKSNVLLLEDMGDMHCYSYHGNQVFDIEHHINVARMRSQNRDFVRKHKEKIIASIKFFKFEGSIKVMSREGLAFEYKGKR
jgi:glycosyltransferase involved in cell wall biosynthesis